MDAIAFSDARRRFAELANQAEEQPVYITRANGKTLVLMDAAELSSIRETEYLLSTEANRDSVARALKDFDEGRVVQISPDDL